MTIAQVQLTQDAPDTSRALTQNAKSGDNGVSAFARKLEEALSEQNTASESRQRSESVRRSRADRAEYRAEQGEQADHAARAGKHDGKLKEHVAAGSGVDELAKEAEKTLRSKKAALIDKEKSVKTVPTGDKQTVALKTTGGKGNEKDGVAKPDTVFSKQVPTDHAGMLAGKAERGESGEKQDEAIESPGDRKTARDEAGHHGTAVSTAPAAAMSPELRVTAMRPDSNREGINNEAESLEGVEKPGSRSRRAVMEVRDYRSREAGGNRDVRTVSQAAAGGDAAEHLDTLIKDGATERVSEGDRDGEGSQIRLVRNLANGADGHEPAARTTQSSAFSAYVRDMVNTHLVKQSGIILKNNNRGEIRLVLKPEHLGRVRLRIQLDDNKLSGRIFVDSSFVKESFEQNLTSLYRSFRDSGFEISEFEVLVDGGEQKNGAEGSSEETYRQSAGGYIETAAKTIQQLDDAVPILEGPDLSDHVNLVV